MTKKSLSFFSLKTSLVIFALAMSQGLSAATLNVEKREYQSDERIVVSYDELPENQTDWIGVFFKGDSHRDYIDFDYTKGARKGEVTFEGLDSGAYEIRMFFNNSYKPRGKVSFIVR